MATFSHIFKPLPSFCLKILVISKGLVASSRSILYIPLVKLSYFHFILNYGRHSDFPALLSFSTLLHKIIILLLWTDSSNYPSRFLSFPDGLKFSLHLETFALFHSSQLPRKIASPRTHLFTPFPLLILMQ